MTQIPDLANLSALAIIAIFAVREFFAYLSKRSNGQTNGQSNGQKIDLEPINQKLDYLCKVAEPAPNAAGDKSSDWWELAFARIVEATVTRLWEVIGPRIIKQCLDEHENKVHRPSTEEATRMRQEILDELQKMERQLALAVAEINRQIRDSNRNG